MWQVSGIVGTKKLCEYICEQFAKNDRSHTHTCRHSVNHANPEIYFLHAVKIILLSTQSKIIQSKTESFGF